MSLFDKVKGMIVETDEQPSPKATPAPAKVQSTTHNPAPQFNGQFSSPFAATATAPAFAPVVDRNDDVYQALVRKTSFDDTAVGAALAELMAPLASSGQDDRSKVKIAVLYGAAKGVTPEKILAAYDALQTILEGEASRFATVVEDQTAHELGERQQRLEEIQRQIAALQEEGQRLTAEAYEAKGRIEAAQHKFETAAAARQIELQQEKAHMAGLLQ